MLCVLSTMSNETRDTEKHFWPSINRYHRQQNKCYPKGVRLSEKLQLTATLCNEI